MKKIIKKWRTNNMLKKTIFLISLFTIMNYCSLKAQNLIQYFDSIKTDIEQLKTFINNCKLNEEQNENKKEFISFIKIHYVESIKNGDVAFVKNIFSTILPVLDKDEKDNLIRTSVQYSQLEITSFFISNGFNINNGSLFVSSVLFIASDNWDSPMIELLLKNNAKIEDLYLNNWTPLGSAIYKLNEGSSESDKERCFEAIKMLIKYGANVNAMLKDGSIPLHRAASTCYVPLIELLLKNGADKFVNYRSEDYNSESYDNPLYFAVINNNPDSDKLKAVSILLDYGADINLPLRDGDPFLYKIMNNDSSEELFRFAIDKGANIHYTDEGGRNVLWTAASNGKEMCVRVLLEKGTDKNKKGKLYGEEKELTPLEVAKKNNYKNIVEILKD